MERAVILVLQLEENERFSKINMLLAAFESTETASVGPLVSELLLLWISPEVLEKLTPIPSLFDHSYRQNIFL